MDKAYAVERVEGNIVILENIKFCTIMKNESR